MDHLAKKEGLSGKVNVTVRRRGLVIQLLTDKVFFSSGDATLHPEAHHLVSKIGEIVRDERSHPVVVEGYTDSQPIYDFALPVQLEPLRRSRRGGCQRLRDDRRPAGPHVSAGLRKPGADRHQFHG